MNVAMMQPSFMPWQGFFELILKSDIFIFLDDFQFSVQSYHQRNRLFIDKGKVGWYTIPVQKSISFRTALNKTKINESTPWRMKMWKRIEHNYSKAAYYRTLAQQIKEWLFIPAETLAGQNIAFIKLVCNLLNINREMRASSDLLSKERGSKRVLELLRWCKAEKYYCANGSFSYMREEGIFPVDDIEVLFQDFKPVPYYQIGSPNAYMPFLSIIDALMNIGPESTLEFIKAGTPKWLLWDDMMKIADSDGLADKEEHFGN
ncbi:MAG: WbqC family protein [Nitrospirae bacterium]|nr:WbqC family protein [Nitrospirota bacterium]